MRKALFFGGVLASLFVVEAKEDAGMAAESKGIREIEETVDHRRGKDALEGFYIAGGLLKSTSITKVQKVEDVIRVTSDLPVVANNLHNGLVFSTRGIPYAAIGMLDAQLGGEWSWGNPEGAYEYLSVGAKCTKVNAVTGRDTRCYPAFSEGRNNKVSGALAFGYDKFFYENYLLGAELTFDFAGNKNADDSEGHFDAVKRKDRGFVPTLAAKIGVYSEYLDTLFYLRLGAAQVRSEINHGARSLKLSKLTPVIGAGVEKIVFDNVSLRVEGDYRIQSEKSGDLFASSGNGTITDTSGNKPVHWTRTGKARIRTKGYAVRVMGVWHI
ncbi:MAG: hypothetical protein LBP41_02295 [Holosporaceae bacterium]|jgi:hypothetical protein|nr:hypothetical protein [Holosporaceae bacterium]